MVLISVRSARLGWPSSSEWKAAATGMGSLMPAGTGQVFAQHQSRRCSSSYKLLTQELS